MIIWINGAFGSGKTQTAHELQRRLNNSFIYDPENAGYFIRKNIPSAMTKSDFQKHPMWREINYTMLKEIHEQYDGTIIVPMTIVHPQYFHEIIGRLRTDGVQVNHFSLIATKDVLYKRLRSRGEGRNSWAAKQIDRCIEGLTHRVFERHIDTNHMTIDDVVTQIAAALNLTLLPDNRGTLRKRYDKIMTQLKHIRFFN